MPVVFTRYLEDCGIIIIMGFFQTKNHFTGQNLHYFKDMMQEKESIEERRHPVSTQICQQQKIQTRKCVAKLYVPDDEKTRNQMSLRRSEIFATNPYPCTSAHILINYY